MHGLDVTRGNHAPACPTLCNGVQRIALTAPRGYAVAGGHLPPCERLLHYLKPATISIKKIWYIGRNNEGLLHGYRGHSGVLCPCQLRERPCALAFSVRVWDNGRKHVPNSRIGSHGVRVAWGKMR